MNSINISHSHIYNKKEACHKAENMLEDLSNSYGLDIETDGEGYISFSGSGINGEVTINHDEITITATLGFLMVAMKSVISNEIKNRLEENFS